MREQFLNKSKRIVIKIGSSILADKGVLNVGAVKSIVEQIAALVGMGKEVIVVTSGAIASGFSELGFQCRPDKLSCLQASAALGQSLLMQTYIQLFKKKKMCCAQVLLTWDDFQVRARYLNAKNTILALLDYNVVPIINENDTVSTEEIKFGDNDRLSALVANVVEADLLILLSDVDGLYQDSRKRTKVISLVQELNTGIEKLAKDTDKKHISKGGMISKLEAVGIAVHSKIPTVIANGKTKDIAIKIVEGKEIGTLFLPKGDRMIAKKRWIAFGVKPHGRIVVDDGAKSALVERNKSLLCPGIVDVEGKFHAGDVVAIVDKEGKEIAKGRVNFSKEELVKSKGKRVAKEVVHRNNLAITYKEK
ncbi:glutamate 5-kinase [Candidatus Omnitrophota bacterium]